MATYQHGQLTLDKALGDEGFILDLDRFGATVADWLSKFWTAYEQILQ